MKCFFLAGMLAIAGLGSASATTLIYTGNAFNTSVFSPGPGNLIGSSITGTITFTGAIFDGAVLGEGDTSAWTFTSAGATWTKGGGGILSFSVEFGADLLPASWEFVIEQDSLGDAEPEQLTSTTPGFGALFGLSEIDQVGFSDATAGAFSTGLSAEGSIADDRGTWANAVPLPAALPMLLAGLGGLMLVRRRP